MMTVIEMVRVACASGRGSNWFGGGPGNGRGVVRGWCVEMVMGVSSGCLRSDWFVVVRACLFSRCFWLVASF